MEEIVKSLMAEPFARHIGGKYSHWVPPPEAWHKLWAEGTADLLPFGLLSPASDFVWRMMWLSVDRLTAQQISEMTGIDRMSVYTMMGVMRRRGCIDRKAANSETRGRAQTEYEPVVPETVMARHLRILQSLPTPREPEGLPSGQSRLWTVMCEHALGAAAHINMKVSAAEKLDISVGRTIKICRSLRLKGHITRIWGCQQSVWRLSGRH